MKNSKPTRLTGKSPVLGTKSIKISVDSINSIMKDLDRTAIFMSEWGTRTTPNFYRLAQVQDLLDYAIEATHGIAWLKRKMVKAGAAQYNPTTGDFEFTFEDKDEEPKEEDTTVSKD